MVSVLLNGEAVQVSSRSVTELLQSRGVDPGKRGIAVALDDAVVPRSAWDSTPVAEGARIEIIAPMQGG